MNSNELVQDVYFVSDKFYSNSILIYICDYLRNRNCLVAILYAEEIKKKKPHIHTKTRTQWYIHVGKCTINTFVYILHVPQRH